MRLENANETNTGNEAIVSITFDELHALGSLLSEASHFIDNEQDQNRLTLGQAVADIALQAELLTKRKAEQRELETERQERNNQARKNQEKRQQISRTIARQRNSGTHQWMPPRLTRP